MITKAQNSSGCESQVFDIPSSSCFDKRVDNFRIEDISFNPITKTLIIKQAPDVIISTEINQLNDVVEPTHLSPVEGIVTSIPQDVFNGVSYLLQIDDKYYHCTWRDTLKYWDRIELKDGYEFFNKEDSVEYRYINGRLENVSTINLSMIVNPDNIEILNPSGDGVTLPLATESTPGLLSKEDKVKLDSIVDYVKNIEFIENGNLKLRITTNKGSKELPIREASSSENGLMSASAFQNLAKVISTVATDIYTKSQVNDLLDSKVDKVDSKDLVDKTQIAKLARLGEYVKDVVPIIESNRTALKLTNLDPNTGAETNKTLHFSDVTDAISGLMTPEYKSYIDSLKYYYTGDITKEYTGTELQLILPIYDPISKTTTNKYLVLDASTSSTAGLITAMEKNKLGYITNIIETLDVQHASNEILLRIARSDTEAGITSTETRTLKAATPTTAGVMTSQDKSKLDNIVKYLSDLIDTDTTSSTQAIIHYQVYNPFLNTYEDKYYNLPMATSTIAGSITSTDFDVIQGLKDVNGNPLTYEGTPSKTWKIGDQILKNEKEGFSVRNEDDTEYGDLIVRNLTIKEDIVFGGDAFIIDTEEVKVTDNILTLNSGEQGEGVTKGISGLEIDRGKLPNYFIIFDESDDRFKCGTEGNQFPLMLRDNEPDMVDGAFLTWNSTFKRAQTTSTVPIQLALRFALQNLSEKDTDLIFKRVDNDLYLQYGDTNDKYLSLRVLDDILFKSSPSATKYVFDKEIWAPAFKRDDGYESAYLDTNIEDRKFLQYDSSKKLIYSSNTVYSDRGGLDFVDNIDDTNCIKLMSNSRIFGIIDYENFTSIEESQPYWSFIISPRNTLTRDAIKASVLDIYTATHDAFGFTNPLILDYVKSYIGFDDNNHRFYGDVASFTFDISGDTIQFIPSPNRSLINTKSPELGFSADIIIPTGFRSSDLSQIVFANYANLSKKYLAWDSSTNAITSIDGFDSLVVVNPDDPSKKVTLVYTNGGFIIVSDSNVPGIPQNVLELSETIGSDGSVTYNLNSTYTPLHVNFPMWGNFCDEDGKPFATVESLVGHYLPLSAGSTNALTGPLYFSPTSALVNKTDTGENAWALFMGDSTNGTSLYLGSFGDYETLLGGDLSNTALLNIDTSGNTYSTRLGYTDEDGNIKAGIVTSGDNLSSQTVIYTIGNNDIKHHKNGVEYIVYDSSNLNVEELLQNYTLEGNIIGTPKATRIKGTTIPSGSDFINNFRELIWGTNDSTTWIVPFGSNSANTGLGGSFAASLGWSQSDTHAYISVSYQSDIRNVIIGGGNQGKINWFEQVAFKSDINKLSSVYYPYSGRGHMTIGADGRPILANSQGILFNKTGGERVEGIYMGSNNHLVLGGSSNTNVPIDMFNDLGITRIVDRSTNYSLLVFTNGGTEDSQYTHIGAERGTTRIRSGLFNLVHDRGGTLYTVFDSYNFSRDLGSTSLNSSFNHFPMMAAQPSNSDATTDRGYPIQQAGSLIVIPGVYNGSSQIYGTYDSNRWFVRAGSPAGSNKDEHTAWKELATTSHLSNYLPLSGGTMSGNIRIPYTSWIEQTHASGSNATSPIKWLSNDASTIMAQIGHATMGGPDSSGSIYIIPRAVTSNPWDGTNGLFIYKGGVKIDGEELAKVSQIPSMSGYLPLSGGTLTRTTLGPTLSIRNTSTNKEAYIDFYKGDVRCGYIGAAASNTENIYLYAYDSRDILIRTTQGSISFETGVNNLIHKKNGTSYTILDTANIASLTIQFNGSTNTTYAPNAAKTVNITPAAIGAAASSHTHTKSQITDFPSSMPASDVYAWAKASSKPSYSWSEITSKPSTFTPSSHSHPLSDISDLQASWDALLKAAPSAYVTRWPSWSEVTSKPSFATVATSGSYNDLSNRPSIPSAETASTIMSKINSQTEITFSKHVVCSQGAGLSSTSDIRFKSNLRSLPNNTLDLVLNSPDFIYNWKEDTTDYIGTSAQYWEDKVPSLVYILEDESNTRTFSYERYTIILQKALKEEHELREQESIKYNKEISSIRKELEDLKLLVQKLL